MPWTYPRWWAVDSNDAQSVFKASLVYQDKNQEALPPLAFYNAPCVIRTHDRLLRRQLLYPAELRERVACRQARPLWQAHPRSKLEAARWRGQANQGDGALRQRLSWHQQA